MQMSWKQGHLDIGTDEIAPNEHRIQEIAPVKKERFAFHSDRSCNRRWKCVNLRPCMQFDWLDGCFEKSIPERLDADFNLCLLPDR